MRKLLLSHARIAFAAAMISLALIISLPGPRAENYSQPVPAVHDWSMRHTVYPHFGPMTAMLAAQQDPRARFSWQRRLPIFPIRRHPEPLPPIFPGRARPTFQRDWSINLGTAGTAPSMYPAKFTFDVTAAPSCANDFVVFPINAAGSATQPNIVAFNYLYSGTAGANGICNNQRTGTSNGTSAAVYWSYNVQGITGGGAATTSPVIYFDPINGATNTGQKVAFVESAIAGQILTASVTPGHGGTGYAAGNAGIINGTGGLATYQVTTVTGGAVTAFTITYPGSGYTTGTGITTIATSGTGTGFEVNINTVSPSSVAAHFHVLAWANGDGFDSTNAQNVLKPKTINTFVSYAPVTGSGTATDLAFGSSTDTLSSPFVDYVYDKAYVGNDAGVLFRIKDVFCTKVNPDCPGTSGAGTPQPSVDLTWGGGTGAVTIGGTCTGTSAKLTGPVLDYTTMNVFVGCADGKLYSVSQTGTVTSLQVGDGVASKTYGGIVDPPMVDGVNEFVYVTTGSANNGAYGALVQTKTNLSSPSVAQIGSGNQCNFHAPALNNAYYNSSWTTAMAYMDGATGTITQPCTAGSTGGTTYLYGVTFGSGGTMTSGAPAHSLNTGASPGGDEQEPLLEFYNATTGIDWLFTAALESNQQNVASWKITSAFPTGFTALAYEGLGPSGMIVDNNSSSGQAASIYFNALGENAACNNNTVLTDTGGCAVKLTQANLN
jgi:hypothetical protein